MFDRNQKRLLALDGGGIMGVITLQFLKRMEDQLRPHSGKGDKFVLSDFFDYIGGTSTGAIIATGLALGKSVDDLIQFYDDAGRRMFQTAGLTQRLWYRFTEGPLAAKLKEVIGDKSILDMQKENRLKSLLLVVTRNASNDSAWPLSTHPGAKYNDPTRADCNLCVPMWQLVRASTAAPTYFRHEILKFGQEEREFVDGGITPYNNPAFLLYKMATLPQYKLGWPSGEDRMMLVSVGTGFAKSRQETVSTKGRWLLGQAKAIPGELMRGIAKENDLNCRVIGRCVYGAQIDSEIGDLIPQLPVTQYLVRSFLYARYDADISPAGLKAMNLGNVDPSSLTMDNVDAMPDLKKVGQVAAVQVDLPRHFE